MKAAMDSDINKRLQAGLILNSVFAAVEFTAGVFAGSLALVSDSVHNMTDSLSLLISFVAQKIANRKATPEHTYGYGKASILAALTNSTILIVVAVFIFYEAYKHILSPEPVQGATLTAVAILGIVMNSTIALLLRKYRTNLNVKSIYVNIVMDVTALVGAFIAGLVIILTGKTIVDPIVGIIISLTLAFSGYKIIDDAVHVLLEGVPEHINISDVENTIASAPNITAVDNLHVWTISTDVTALSCHVVVNDYNLANNVRTIERIKNELRERFGIEHTTIEIGLAPTPPHEH